MYIKGKKEVLFLCFQRRFLAIKSVMPAKEKKRKRRELTSSNGGPGKPPQPKSVLSSSENRERAAPAKEETIHRTSSDSSYVPKSVCFHLFPLPSVLSFSSALQSKAPSTKSPWTTKSPHLSPAILAAAQPFMALPDFSLGIGEGTEDEDSMEKNTEAAVPRLLFISLRKVNGSILIQATARKVRLIPHLLPLSKRSNLPSKHWKQTS